MKTIAISQRVAMAPGTGERRDCLAQDWYPFLDAVGVLAVPMPNNPDRAARLASALGVEGLILTGGDDIGVFPERDATEIRLLEWCEDRGAPVIGVCRGFQVMAHRLGAALLPVNPGIHRAKRHTVVFADGCEREVNSYHNMGVSIENRRDFPMAPLAWCGKDRSLEAAASAKDAAMMWHPEREPAPDPADVALFKKYLRID